MLTKKLNVIFLFRKKKKKKIFWRIYWFHFIFFFSFTFSLLHYIHFTLSSIIHFMKFHSFLYFKKKIFNNSFLKISKWNLFTTNKYYEYYCYYPLLLLLLPLVLLPPITGHYLVLEKAEKDEVILWRKNEEEREKGRKREREKKKSKKKFEK